MPMYLTRFSYTPETWAMMIAQPEDRRKAATAYIESVGGKLHGFWYGFGAHDGVNLWEAPDNVSMAAVALAISDGDAPRGYCPRPWACWSARPHSRHWTRPAGRRPGARAGSCWSPARPGSAR